LVVAIDAGKAWNRVWLSTDAAGLVVEPLSVPVLRSGLDELDALVRRHSPDGGPIFAVETTGALHRAWVAELNRRGRPATCGCSCIADEPACANSSRSTLIDGKR